MSGVIHAHTTFRANRKTFSHTQPDDSPQTVTDAKDRNEKTKHTFITV